MEVIKRVFFTSLFLAVLVSGQAFPGKGQTCTKPVPRCPRTWSYPALKADNTAWGNACSAWSQCNQRACNDNNLQSPINIVPPVLRNGARDSPLNIRYKSLRDLYLFNTGNYYTFGVNKRDGLTFTWNGNEYYLRKVEFHSPSEHTILGKQFDMEVQFFHDSGVSTAPTLISSIFFQRNSQTGANQFLESIIYSLPEFSDCRCGNGRVENVPTGTAEFPQVPTTMGSEDCDEGARNTNGNSTSTCCRPNCRRPRCGDGVIDAGEACDNGANNSNTRPNACRTSNAISGATCCLPSCGDGVVDDGEECDDGNRHNLDGCSSICRNECGDSELNTRNGLEQCDNGPANNNTIPNACRQNCRLPSCGDGVVDANETCDSFAIYGVSNGFGDLPSQCRVNCTAPVCGDAITDINEECDHGDRNGAADSICSANCTITCGNGLASPAKVCDNTIGGGVNSDNSSTYDQGCRTICIRPRCGDGVIDEGECCDSIYAVHDAAGNEIARIGNKWCDSNCNQLCGNGLNDSAINGEQCDHGCYNADLPNRCRRDCTKPRCGDGIVDSGECCDTGDASLSLLPNMCRPGCALPKCGDGTVDNLFGETCDDGNTVAGDGCDPTCRKECGNAHLEVFIHPTNPLLNYVEQCDLGNANSNTPDNCRTNCMLPMCGDGIIDTLEECDNAVNNSDTTPNACRKNCRIPYCGDGVIDTQNGEKCDAGALNSDTTPNGCSRSCIPNFCRQRPVGFVDFPAALPHNRTSYVYDGSYSQPPCSTGVKWLIFSEVQPMTERQLTALTTQNGMPMNARTCQMDCGRKITRPQTAAAPMCGNGIVEGTEACDNGWANNDQQANACRTNCVAKRCGDGVTDSDEECDDASFEMTKLGMPPRMSGLSCSGCKLIRPRSNPFRSAAGAWSYQSTCRWMFSVPTCGGSQQSPIDITPSGQCDSSPLTYRYADAIFNVINTGKVVAATFPGSTGGFSDGAKDYSLQRVEFHSPSEHTLRGVHADVEVQLHHSAADGSRSAIAILFNVGPAKSKLIDQFSFYFPQPSCKFGNGMVDPQEQCDDGILNSDSKPNACRRNGKLPSCGDGVVDRGEECDYGRMNADAANSCKPSTCRLPYCGDGYLDAGEECDYNQVGTKPCSRKCMLYCGNGLLEVSPTIAVSEACDNGTANSDVVPNACRTSCRLPSCGDNVIDKDEDCDDGTVLNLSNRTGCRSNCKRGTCGDGFQDSVFGEQCDDGDASNGPDRRCSKNCTLNCGDGVKTGAEECDNGRLNGATDNACRVNCVAARCGDGLVDSSLGEECDTGPLTLTTDPICRNCILTCGNGELQAANGEECDDGTLNDDVTPNCCRTNCRKPHCGDGVRDAGEDCDFGSANSDQHYNATLGVVAQCRPVTCVLPKCGDGIVDFGEECDDTNNANGDGCSSTCRRECGNGRRDSAAEECDDGALNANAADACRLNCRLPVCGDGIVDSGEQCDSTSRGNGDGQCREGCTLPYCGDGFVDTLFGEECDNGGNNNDLAVGAGACSTSCKLNDCNTCSSSRPASFAGAFDATSPVHTYAGSLTSPPCTEGVTWHVMQNIHSLSPRQLQVLKNALPIANSRGVQRSGGAVCKLRAPVCGNCVLEAGEQCDSGDNNANAADKCRLNCRKPMCGDGIVDSGEECDDGAAGNNAMGPCGLNCRPVRGCPVTCSGASCGSCSASATSNASTCSSCPGTCPSSSVTNSGTIININFANLLRGAGCGSGSSGSCGCNN